MPPLSPLSAQQLAELMSRGQVQLIDVREPGEYAREHINTARNLPLSSLPQAVSLQSETVVFVCRSGYRTQTNASLLAACVGAPAYALSGGVDGWKSAGFTTHIDHSKPIDMMRQVQIIAGLLILTGVALGTWLSPVFYGLSAFVGAGLLLAGTTGFCGMARILAYAAWNRMAR